MVINIDEIKPNDPENNEGFFIIVSGNVGIGKSTFASTFPAPLFIDLEGTASNIKGIKRITLEWGQKTKEEDTRDLAFMQLLDITEQFLKSNKYKTLVLDGGVELIQIITDYTLKYMGREDIKQHKFGDTYSTMREKVEKYIKNIIGKGKNIVLITHLEELTEVDDLTDEEYILRRPLFNDKKLAYKIPALASIVGVIRFENKKRVFDCVPRKEYALKNQFNITKLLEPNYESLKTEIEKFYKGGDNND